MGPLQDFINSWKRKPKPPTPPTPVEPVSTRGRIHQIAGPFHPRLYSYWANAWVRSEDNITFVLAGHEGFGPLLYMILPTGQIEPYAWNVPPGTTEGWYWDRTGYIYIPSDSSLIRYNPTTRDNQIAFDISHVYPDCRITQCHSSDDGQVHCGTVQRTSDWVKVAFVVSYRGQLQFFAPEGSIDECQIDKSGQWLITKEVDPEAGSLFNNVYHLPDGAHYRLSVGAGIGHSDTGEGFIIGEDSNNGKTIRWDIKMRQRFELFDTWNMGHVSVRGNLALFSRHEKGGLELRDLTTNQVVYKHTHGVVSNDYDVQVRANLSPCGRRATWTQDKQLYVLEL